MSLAEVSTLDEIDLELISVIDTYQRELNRLSELTGAIVRQAFMELPTVQRQLLDRFIDDAGPYVNAARLEGAELTSGLIADLAQRYPPPIDLRFPTPTWDHPFLRTWHDLKVGQSWEQARLGGASQAEAIGRDAVHQGAHVRMANTGLRVVGYRRVLSPNACKWCQVVASQRYASFESANFGHGGPNKPKNCRCSIVAIIGRRDPGQLLNARRYAELKASGAVDAATAARTRARRRR